MIKNEISYDGEKNIATATSVHSVDSVRSGFLKHLEVVEIDEGAEGVDFLNSPKKRLMNSMQG
jgi:hypothetical protein